MTDERNLIFEVETRTMMRCLVSNMITHLARSHNYNLVVFRRAQNLHVSPVIMQALETHTQPAK
jgi:hypothetical protein